jgi:hypothetical protein
VAGISITFMRDGSGAVTGLVLHQNGDHAAPKLSAGPKAITLDAATLGEYAGRYRFDFGAVFDITLKGDHLDAQMTGQPALPFLASARDRFFYRVVDAQLTFERDADGKVVALVLHRTAATCGAAGRGGAVTLVRCMEYSVGMHAALAGANFVLLESLHRHRPRRRATE